MDCRTARSLLDLARPRRAELDAGEAEALDRHVNSCLECDALFRQERGVDDHIGRAVRDVPVPRDLRERVLERLDRERRAWWYERVPRVGSLVAAAAVLLVMSLAGYLSHIQPPLWPLDLELARVDMWSQHPTPERVEEWFRDRHGLALAAPRDVDGQLLNYNLLAYYGLVDLQGGRSAPMLLFVNGNKQARVYLLTAKKFDLKSLPSMPPPASMGLRIDVRVLSESANPSQADVYFYTDSPEGLKPFVLSGGGPG